MSLLSFTYPLNNDSVNITMSNALNKGNIYTGGLTYEFRRNT